ncbi:hypothetical protein BGZ74_009339 [Mortierella antarctica]|nr:hypothetical protein BGZ74_009339 [Mortierella antarctica]
MSLVAISTPPSPPSPPHKQINPPDTQNCVAPPTTFHKPSALDIPEILLKIGHAIPQFSTYVTVRYFPKQILRCTRVSRLWYSVMMPLVWHSFHDSVMSAVPAHVLKQNAHWIRVLNHQHNFGGQNGIFAACQNLVQLTLSPWVEAVDELVKANKRLTKVCWTSGGHRQEMADSSLEAISLLPRLEVLQFSSFKLNHRKLLITLDTLSNAGRRGLVSLVLLDVIFLDPVMSAVAKEAAEKTVPERVTPKDLQISQNLVHSPILNEFVSRCTSLERLQINGDKSIFLIDESRRLSKCLAENCPRLKFFHYDKGNNYGLFSLPKLLPAVVAYGYIMTINGREQGKPAPQDANEEEPWWPIGLKLDILSLDYYTAIAIRTLDFLDTLDLTLFETEEASSVTADLMNTVQIVTTCRHLRVFQLEYVNLLRLNEPMLSPGQACFLFLQPWSCTYLERFAYSGIKRPVKRETAQGIVVGTVPNGEDMYLPLKMSELLMDVSQVLPAWAFESSVKSVRKNQREASTSSSTGQRIDEGYLGTTVLDDIREFQERLFAQVRQLKRLRTIAFNGEERSDFSAFV